MNKIFSWIKANKLAFILLLIVVYFLFSKYFVTSPISKDSSLSYPVTPQSAGADLSLTRKIGGLRSMPASLNEAPPTTDVSNRLVISESYLSLLVNNVTEAQKQIIQTAESLGGYMVNSNLNNPQDAPTATVTVRVPSAKLQETLQSFRGLGVKVVSENLSGQDVTDEFVDNEARLETLEKTKAKFEEILDNAISVQDILTVQREIINLQSQIDAVKGQQNYLEKSAQMAKLTIYLSTDELALPYAPSETWRPAVIFKQAVRSLFGSARKLGTLIIWFGVYSIIWFPVLLVYLYLKGRKKLG